MSSLCSRIRKRILLKYGSDCRNRWDLDQQLNVSEPIYIGWSLGLINKETDKHCLGWN